ncbi:hypothetical protein CAPTEDRAFT_138118 [Capitella teleta]|uniref:Tetratricopeptide repeat protein 39C n=1 Tax=Capitella teleta TaxID=283909 RepID=R7UPD2_CAPTE|nr:hypothetical protein CAPTEDRAFT_138118 [Capitella teleta]|eukprot:ELU08384.1 hypothetical protein CAPTEDRAFT_138118 [Capitella teleta]
MKKSPSLNGDQDDVEMSLQGMTMILNNEWEEAETLFSQYKDTSPLMCAGHSMYIFMQALMSFEEEKLAEAMKALQATEKFCNSSSIFKSRKKKLKQNAHRLEDKYDRQIIVADSILYQAMLTFVQQDIAGYVKGGWLLRKAWKYYNKLHKEITALHEKTKVKGSAEHLPEADRGGITPSPSDTSLKRSSESLLGAISFGFGTFQLCLSLIPPRVLKIIEFLGFEGDRQVGLIALDVASRSRDMKAPLATLGLVWYHTVIRPFFALDGQNWSAGIADGKAVLERGQRDYPKSALFLFFRARIYRLQSQADEALATYNIALEACASQRETQLICHHEIGNYLCSIIFIDHFCCPVGWIQMMCMKWKEAYECFHKLKCESRWSKSFYGYLSACTLGAMGDTEAAHKEMLEVPTLVQRKNNQIEQFVLRRADRFKTEKPTSEHATLLLFEVLYLWNAIPTCRKQDIEKMISECNNIDDKKLFHLRSLIEGALYNELENPEMAQMCFEESIARHHGVKYDFHVPAFASYEIGMMLAKQPQTFSRAKKYLEQAKEQYKDFDFDGRLHVRVNAALKRIRSEGTPL